MSDAQTDTPERGFIGFFIPTEWIDDSRLIPTDWLILAEIEALSKSKKSKMPGWCYASNQHIAEFIKKEDETWVSKRCSYLEKIGYLEQRFTGRVMLRRLSSLGVQAKADLAAEPKQPWRTDQSSLGVQANQSIKVKDEIKNESRAYPPYSPTGGKDGGEVERKKYLSATGLNMRTENFLRAEGVSTEDMQWMAANMDAILELQKEKIFVSGKRVDEICLALAEIRENGETFTMPQILDAARNWPSKLQRLTKQGSTATQKMGLSGWLRNGHWRDEEAIAKAQREKRRAARAEERRAFWQSKGMPTEQIEAAVAEDMQDFV